MPDPKPVVSLTSVALFNGLGDDEKRALEQCALPRKVRKNNVVIHDGERSDSLFVILQGKVKIYLNDEEGKEVIINYQGIGEYFGELALLGETDRSASVMTVEDSIFSIIEKSAFLAMMARHPNIAITLIKNLVHRVYGLTDQVKALALMDVYGRVAKMLTDLAVQHNDVAVIELRLTQQDIASRVGASREMVSRIMKDLTVGGYISVNKKHITIHKPLPHRY
ncbi:MAG: Crp/Fnr family transcriptional regulator [Gammaproteobacteria bacterium]|nr:Crp/Fnr family transcriptional regulator [Gammaproteobacteria bacterium]